MKFQNSHHYSPEIELILHPQSYSFKEISKYIVASILALSQQYSDPDGMRTARIQSNLRWHAISEVYEPAFGACKYTNQLQGIKRISERTLQVISCKTGKIFVEGTLR